MIVFVLEIWFSRWLSGRDLKKVALFGCRSLAKKSVFGAKRLRKFFEIPEETVSRLSCLNISLPLTDIFVVTYCINLMSCISVAFQVCSKCVLRESCKFVNKSVWRGHTNNPNPTNVRKTNPKNLNLADVMNTITLYALESVHPQLVVPEDVTYSVSRLLKEILKLSQTSS